MGFPNNPGNSTREITGVNSFPIKGTIPSFITGTGNITTKGSIVTGDGTNIFDSEIHGSRFIYSALTNEVRRIRQVYNANTLFLESPFSTDITSPESLKFVKIRAMQVSVRNKGSNTGQFENRDIDAGEAINNYVPNGLYPITYDATGTTFEFSIMYV